MFTPARLAAVSSGLFLLVVVGCVPQADFDNVRAQNNELTSQLATTRADADQAAKTSQTRAAADKAQIDSLTTELEKTKADAKQIMDAADALKPQMTKALADLQNANVYWHEAENKVKELNAALDAKTKALDQAKTEAQNATAAVASAQADLKKSEADNAALTAQIATLKAQLAAKAPTTRP